jgi:hypothetical protein
LARFLGGRLQAILHIYSKLNSADALKFSENFTKLKSATDGAWRGNAIVRSDIIGRGFARGEPVPESDQACQLAKRDEQRNYAKSDYWRDLIITGHASALLLFR